VLFMTVYLFCDPQSNCVEVTGFVVFPDGRTRGKCIEIIHPGEDFHGHPYEELVRLGDGEHNLEPKGQQSAQPGR
jgi:hypothetical protein